MSNLGSGRERHFSLISPGGIKGVYEEPFSPASTLPAVATTFPWLAASAEPALDAQGVKLVLFDLVARLSLQVNLLVDLSFYFNLLVVYCVRYSRMRCCTLDH